MPWPSTPWCSHSSVFEVVNLDVDVLFLFGHFFMWKLHKSNTPLDLVSLKMTRKVQIDPHLAFFGLTTMGGHWSLLLKIFLGGHGDNKPTNFHHKKSSINLSSNVAWPPWLMMNWSSNILCTYLSCLYMYNYINCCYVKTSFFSLINCANFMYMVCGGLSFSLWKS